MGEYEIEVGFINAVTFTSMTIDKNGPAPFSADYKGACLKLFKEDGTQVGADVCTKMNTVSMEHPTTTTQQDQLHLPQIHQQQMSKPPNLHSIQLMQITAVAVMLANLLVSVD